MELNQNPKRSVLAVSPRVTPEFQSENKSKIQNPKSKIEPPYYFVYSLMTEAQA
jgi:hypothetical protein